jgi:ectoine hydroxylase-related dioxygenase (phytanoyl-CoA dioxygenase family)
MTAVTSTIDTDLDQLVSERPLSDAQVEQFWTDGYLMLKGVLSPAEAAHYRQAILDLFPRDLSIPAAWHSNQGRVKPYRILEDGTHDDCWDTPELLPLFANEKIYAAIAQLLESPRLRVFDGSLGYTFRNESQREKARSQTLHLDCSVPKDKPFEFTLQETQLGGCFYFTDVEPDGGGIHVVPGGHRWVKEESAGHADNRSLHGTWRELEFLESVEVTGEAGDFALLHHLMPHGASHNRKTTTRVAQFLRYVRDDQPYDGNRPPRSFNAAQLSVMTPLARRLHGVDPW